jgi:hypothetical protein
MEDVFETRAVSTRKKGFLFPLVIHISSIDVYDALSNMIPG